MEIFYKHWLLIRKRRTLWTCNGDFCNQLKLEIFWGNYRTKENKFFCLVTLKATKGKRDFLSVTLAIADILRFSCRGSFFLPLPSSKIRLSYIQKKLFFAKEQLTQDACIRFYLIVRWDIFLENQNFFISLISKFIVTSLFFQGSNMTNWLRWPFGYFNINSEELFSAFLVIDLDTYTGNQNGFFWIFLFQKVFLTILFLYPNLIYWLKWLFD